MSDIRWGVIGAGGIAARRVMPEAQAMDVGATFVSAMCRTQESAQSVADRFGIPHACTNIDELLTQEIDAIYVASPQDAHCEQVIACAKAGKHILCEKPMAISLNEVDRMSSAIAEAGIKFMLGFCMRYNAYNAKARELVQAGALGQMVMGRAQLTCWYPPIPGAWRQDRAISHGGCLLDMGTHCLDLLEWIMGTTVVAVTGFQAKLTHDYPTDVEDASTLAVQFANGAHGIIDNYFNLPDAAAQNALELHGTKGCIIGQGTVGQDPTGKMFSIVQGEETGYDANQERDIEPARQVYELEGEGIYGQMIGEFCECIRDDKESSIPLADGRHSVELVEAVYKAVTEKRVVEIAKS